MKNAWYDVTCLQLAIARAVLRGDVRGETVLKRILAEELDRLLKIS